MTNDKFLEEMLKQGKIRPLKGHLWAEKWTIDHQFAQIEGGALVQGELRASGLFLPSGKTKENLDYLAHHYIVRALGTDPEWSYNLSEKELKTAESWQSQRIEIGTMIASRAVNGIDQSKNSHYIQLRYDEICAIAGPLEEDDTFPEVYPTPGWVVLEVLDEGKSYGTLTISDSLSRGMRIGHTLRCRVYSTPRNIQYPFEVGSIVAVPSHSGNGATEWVELDKFRVCPLDDILGVYE